MSWCDKSMNYNGDINFMFSTIIKEYDIEKANISILKYKQLISEETYQRLYNSDRMTRQIEVGKFERRDPNISITILSEIRKSRNNFFDITGLKKSDCICIKNDAIFIIDPLNILPQCIEVYPGVRYRVKNIYTDYLKLPNKIELFYFYDQISQTEKCDVKGISDDLVMIHKNYFLDFLCYIITLAHNGATTEALRTIQAFYSEYISMKSDLEFYRQFNTESRFRLKGISNQSFFEANFLSENERSYIDPSYNAEMLRYISSILASALYS